MSHLSRSTRDETAMSTYRSPLMFFLLVFALSIPIWMIGATATFELLPGLPVSSLMAFCPLVSASILVYRETKIDGLVRLLKRSFDFKQVKAMIWYIPTILMMPIIMLVSYVLMRIFQIPLPDLHFPALSTIVMMLLMFFIAAFGEEVGWMGYAIDQLQVRWGKIQASLMLGLVGAIWHIIPLLQVGRSPTWIVWQGVAIAAQRVILVWIYNKAGKSVFVAILFHIMVNLSWQLFPNNGSHYDPRIAGLVSVFVAVIILVVWARGRITKSREASPLRSEGGA